jgi:hypothetical protein
MKKLLATLAISAALVVPASARCVNLPEGEAMCSEWYQKGGQFAKHCREARQTFPELECGGADAKDHPTTLYDDKSVALRNAQTYIKAGQAAEKSDSTCAGLMTAANDYLTAAKSYQNAGEDGKANELSLRHTALVHLVERAKQAGKCGARQTALPPPLKQDSPNKKRECLAAVQYLQSIGLSAQEASDAANKAGCNT